MHPPRVCFRSWWWLDVMTFRLAEQTLWMFAKKIRERAPVSGWHKGHRAHHKHSFVPSFLFAHTLVSLNGCNIEAIWVFLSAFAYRFRNGLQRAETSYASLLPGGSRDFGIPRKWMEHPGTTLNVWRRLCCYIFRYLHTPKEGAAKYFYNGFVHRLMVCSMYGLPLCFSILS